MTNQDIADFIDEMIDLLREDGWCQHTLRDDVGRRCLVGAAADVARRTRGQYMPVLEAMNACARRQYRGPSVVHANNEVFTCEDDAVRFLKEVKDAL